MGIFDKWILAKAERIKAEKAAIEKAAAEQHHREYTIRRELINSAKSKLYALIKKKSEEFSNAFPCELQIGDRAVLNHYSLRRTGNNGWDGGPGSLLSNIPKSELTKPVIVKITSVRVDCSLADERLDKFIDQVSEDFLRKHMMNDSLEKQYEFWITNGGRYKGAIIGDEFGFYWTAHFEYEGSFKPRWGLNSNSFISDKFPEFEKTVEIWQEEIDLNRELELTKAKLSELTAKKELLSTKYREQ